MSTSRSLISVLHSLQISISKCVLPKSLFLVLHSWFATSPLHSRPRVMNLSSVELVSPNHCDTNIRLQCSRSRCSHLQIIDSCPRTYRNRLLLPPFGYSSPYRHENHHWFDVCIILVPLIIRTTTVTVGGGTVTVTKNAPLIKRAEPKQRRGATTIPPCIHFF
jgi:hypothetical protein